MQNFFYHIAKNFVCSFRGRNLWWHFSAVILTFVFVMFGFDQFYFESTRNASLQSLLFPAVILGGIFPVTAPFVLLMWGTIKKDLKLMNAAFAIGQAGFLGWIISSAYKIFTGRIPPQMFHDIADNISTIDLSGGFHFGFLRGGVFWGWPSSHTTVAFSIALALCILYSQNKKIWYAALAYAWYVGLGVSISIHWFSDFMAGAIIGTVIGVVVGKSFLEKYRLFIKI